MEIQNLSKFNSFLSFYICRSTVLFMESNFFKSDAAFYPVTACKSGSCKAGAEKVSYASAIVGDHHESL